MEIALRRPPRLLLAAATVILGLAATAWALARRAGLQPMLVRGGSMLPALPPGSRIAVSPIVRPPARGAVVVLAAPGRTGLEVVKRVVGLPGERVRLVDGRVEVDGRLLPEPYLAAALPLGSSPPAELDLVLGVGEYLVLGDRRDASTDGRAFGPVRADQLVGLVRFAYWPPRRPR